MKKIWEFISSKKYFIYAILGVILLSMTFKAQIIILSYDDQYSLRMEYTVYGYCIRASAALKATEPAIKNEIYVCDSIDKSVLKAVAQLEELGGEGKTIKLMSTGFPKNNDKLEEHLIELLNNNGKKAELLTIGNK